MFVHNSNHLLRRQRIAWDVTAIIRWRRIKEVKPHSVYSSNGLYAKCIKKPPSLIGSGRFETSVFLATLTGQMVLFDVTALGWNISWHVFRIFDNAINSSAFVLQSYLLSHFDNPKGLPTLLIGGTHMRVLDTINLYGFVVESVGEGGGVSSLVWQSSRLHNRSKCHHRWLRYRNKEYI